MIIKVKRSAIANNIDIAIEVQQFFFPKFKFTTNAI